MLLGLRLLALVVVVVVVVVTLLVAQLAPAQQCSSCVFVGDKASAKCSSYYGYPVASLYECLRLCETSTAGSGVEWNDVGTAFTRGLAGAYRAQAIGAPAYIELKFNDIPAVVFPPAGSVPFRMNTLLYQHPLAAAATGSLLTSRIAIWMRPSSIGGAQIINSPPANLGTPDFEHVFTRDEFVSTNLLSFRVFGTTTSTHRFMVVRLGKWCGPESGPAASKIFAAFDQNPVAVSPGVPDTYPPGAATKQIALAAAGDRPSTPQFYGAVTGTSCTVHTASPLSTITAGSCSSTFTPVPAALSELGGAFAAGQNNVLTFTREALVPPRVALLQYDLGSPKYFDTVAFQQKAGIENVISYFRVWVSGTEPTARPTDAESIFYHALDDNELGVGTLFRYDLLGLYRSQYVLVEVGAVVDRVNNALQGGSMFASIIAAAGSPALSFGVARQQMMVEVLQGAKGATCAGTQNGSLPVATSPLQLEIGSSVGRYYVGAAVGNVVLAVALVLLAQAAGTLYLKQTGSSSWNRPFAVFARCHVAMVLFVCVSLLLSPTLSVALVVVTVGDVPAGERALAVIFAAALLAVTAYYTVWALFLRRTRSLEAYKPLPKARTSSSAAAAAPSCLSKTIAYWFVGDGEWQLVYKVGVHAKRNGSRARFTLTEHDRLCFDAATPVMDGFSVKWFSIVEFAVQVALALAEMVTQLVAGNVSCVTSAVIQAVVLGAYILLCVWLRPFQERFLRITTPLMTAAQIVIVVIVAATTSSGLPDWVDALVMVVVSVQSVLVICVVLGSLVPLAAWVRRVVQRLGKSRLRSTFARRPPSGRGAAARSESQRTTLRSLLREEVGFTTGDAVELRDVAAVLRPAAAAAERSSRTRSAEARRNVPGQKRVPPPPPPPPPPPRGSSLSRVRPRREESTAALPRNLRAGRPVSSRIAMEEI